MDYSEFLAAKAHLDPATGITENIVLPDVLFAFQRDIVAWALRRGRAAIFAGTGLGKSLMELSWGQQVSAFTGRPILHLAPLAVSGQMVREANKFGIPAQLVSHGEECGTGINVTNYQKLEHFDLSRFGGVILDESSILKNHNGHYRNALISACQQIPFRLAATATPAPNDFMELGNHSEFLGVMPYTSMLAMFFTHDGSETQKWRLKGHAENKFWEWMASWAVMLRKPSDLGYSNDGYDLPPLNYNMHTVSTYEADPFELFGSASVAQSLSDRIKARRDSVSLRVERAASVTPADDQFVWWCNLNSESEMLAKIIPGAVETRGSDSDDVKERKILDFIEGKTRVLVSKASVCGYGMNFQFCNRTGFIGMNDSWEQFYQAVRRFWRFGQTKPVDVEIIAADTEGATIANIARKDSDAERMADAMVRHTKDLTQIALHGKRRTQTDYLPTMEVELPKWIAA